MNQVLKKTFTVCGCEVRAMLLPNSQIIVCVYDLCRAMKRPNYMAESPVATNCPTARKWMFQKATHPIWGVSPTDVIVYLKKIKDENTYTKRNFKEIEKWLKSLSSNDILDSLKPKEDIDIEDIYGTNDDYSLINNNVQIFEYKGVPVTFLGGNNKCINATQMAKVFDKSPAYWLRNSSTKSFLAELSELRNCNPTDLVKVVYGDDGGTWMHEDVAIEFARWLSPSFAVWCNDRIKELMTRGVTATPTALEEIIADPSFAIKTLTALKEEREAKLEAMRKLDAACIKIEEQRPKANYYNVVVEEREMYTTLQIAAELGICYQTLRHRLYKQGVVTAGRGPLYLTEPYEDCGELVHPVGKKNYKALKWNKLGREKFLT